mmetsp:Transcript_4944/g.22332  ORF Transcript_4944/g.22332 Transcript_4944/m.22332 type:complete len:202 (+) Transcript_4944:737-1342(+)
MERSIWGLPSSARMSWTMALRRSAASVSTAAMRFARPRSRASRATRSRSDSSFGSSVDAYRENPVAIEPLRLRSSSRASLNRRGRVLSFVRVIVGTGFVARSASGPSSREVDGGERRSIAARRSASSRNLPSPSALVCTAVRPLLKVSRDPSPWPPRRDGGRVRQRAWRARRHGTDRIVDVTFVARIVTVIVHSTRRSICA